MSEETRLMLLHNEAAVVALEAGVAADHTPARRISPPDHKDELARPDRKFTSQNKKEPSYHTARSSLGKTRTQSAL